MTAEASDDDLEACVALWLHALEVRDGHPPVEGTAERCRGKFALARVAWVVLRDELAEIAAFSLVTGAGTGRPADPPAAAYLSLFAVAPGRQGSGLGGRLLRAVHERIASAGYDEAVLHVLVENAVAVGLYRSQGWVEVGERFPHPLNGSATGTFVSTP